MLPEGWASGLGAGAVAGAGGLVGGLLNIRQAHHNRAFQKGMYQNAIRYRMQDLKRSGINPILAPQLAGSTPGGAQANVGDLGSGAAASAYQAHRQTKANLSLTQAQEDRIKAEIDQIRANTAKVSMENAASGYMIAEQARRHMYFLGHPAKERTRWAREGAGISGEINAAIEGLEQFGNTVLDGLGIVSNTPKRDVVQGTRGLLGDSANSAKQAMGEITRAMAAAYDLMGAFSIFDVRKPPRDIDREFREAQQWLREYRENEPHRAKARRKRREAQERLDRWKRERR